MIVLNAMRALPRFARPLHSLTGSVQASGKCLGMRIFSRNKYPTQHEDGVDLEHKGTKILVMVSRLQEIDLVVAYQVNDPVLLG